MRAARVHGWGQPPVLEDVPDPVPADGETLVGIAAATVAHLDVTVAGGNFAYRPDLPYVPGTDGAGHVLRSTCFPPGTAVRVRGAGVGLRRDGTWAQAVAAPDRALEPVPEGVDLTLAATFFSPATTAHVAVAEVGVLAAGERVAVTGAAGAVGSLAVQLAQRAGAREVLGIVSRAGRTGAVPPGATVCVGRGSDTLAALGRDGGIDLLIDTVGGSAVPDLLPAMRPGGRVALVGYTAGLQMAVPLPALLAADVALLPVNLLRRGPALGPAAADLLDLLHRGALTLRVEEHPLEDVGAALERLRSGEATGRVVLRMGAP